MSLKVTDEQSPDILVGLLQPHGQTLEQSVGGKGQD